MGIYLKKIRFARADKFLQGKPYSQLNSASSTTTTKVNVRKTFDFCSRLSICIIVQALQQQQKCKLYNNNNSKRKENVPLLFYGSTVSKIVQAIEQQQQCKLYNNNNSER